MALKNYQFYLRVGLSHLARDAETDIFVNTTPELHASFLPPLLNTTLSLNSEHLLRVLQPHVSVKFARTRSRPSSRARGDRLVAGGRHRSGLARTSVCTQLYSVACEKRLQQISMEAWNCSFYLSSKNCSLYRGTLNICNVHLLI
jgi:hypothetical protein